MVSKKKLSALYAKHIFGQLTIEELLSVAVFEEFSLGSNWYPVGKIKRRNKMFLIYMSEDDEHFDVPCDKKVKLVGDIVKVMSLNDDIEIKIKLETNPFL